jgi:hypothetical protein
MQRFFFDLHVRHTRKTGVVCSVNFVSGRLYRLLGSTVTLVERPASLTVTFIYGRILWPLHLDDESSGEDSVDSGDASSGDGRKLKASNIRIVASIQQTFDRNEHGRRPRGESAK